MERPTGRQITLVGTNSTKLVIIIAILIIVTANANGSKIIPSNMKEVTAR